MTRSTSVADEVTDGELPKLVSNEPLSYATCYYDQFPADKISAAIRQLYNADAIHNAEVLILHNFSSHLPKMENRRDGHTKKAYMTECEDILRAIGNRREI